LVAEMKQTKSSNLIFFLISSAIATFFIVRFIVQQGSATPLSPTNLLITVPAIGLVVLGLAYPVWAYRRAIKEQIVNPKKPRAKRIDPFYAVQVLLLAKATAIAGSLFAGWHLGVLVFQLGSPVVATDSTLRTGLGLAGSILMLICGYLAELICRLPEDPNATSNKKPETAPV
jgi:hypothetical protein